MWNPVWLSSTVILAVKRITDFFASSLIRISGSSPSQSVSVYVICNDANELSNIESLEKSGVLKVKLEELINILTMSSSPIKISLSVDQTELGQCRTSFANQVRYYKLKNFKFCFIKMLCTFCVFYLLYLDCGP